MMHQKYSCFIIFCDKEHSQRQQYELMTGNPIYVDYHGRRPHLLCAVVCVVELFNMGQGVTSLDFFVIFLWKVFSRKIHQQTFDFNSPLK
jgi:hypothetical protein